MLTPPTLPFRTNLLLAALPTEDYERIAGLLESIRLDVKDILYESDQITEYVYFPLSGMASILVRMDEGRHGEVSLVGKEGMVGLQLFLGGDTVHTNSFYQIAGQAARMRREAFKSEIEHNGALVGVLQHYTLAYLSVLAQNSACNSQHHISERCARWLLLTHDRVGGNRFALKQEFLSDMLGVRRAGISTVMNSLQADGAIRYSRGIITIVDRAKLEAAACACYGIIAGEYKRLLGFGFGRND